MLLETGRGWNWPEGRRKEETARKPRWGKGRGRRTWRWSPAVDIDRIFLWLKQRPQARRRLQKMPSHDTMKVGFDLGDYADNVKAVYKRLTSEDLLKRCLKGKTKNPNESLHNRIWNLWPKVPSLRKKTFEFAIAQAVVNYNVGYEAGSLASCLGIESCEMVKLQKEMDVSKETLQPSKSRKKWKTLLVDPSCVPGSN